MRSVLEGEDDAVQRAVRGDSVTTIHVERAELARLNGDEATRRPRLFLETGSPVRAEQVAKARLRERRGDEVLR